MNWPKGIRLTRRGFLLGTAASGIAAATYAFGIEPHWIDVVERSLPIAALPQSLVGCRLIQISDLHVGPIVDDAYLLRAFDLVARLEPDVLVITGDFMSYRLPEHLDQTARVMERLKLARLATLGILGNHDYCVFGKTPSGRRLLKEHVADRLTQRMHDCGIEVLRNEVRDVQGLNVVGLDDYWGPNFRPQRVLASLSPTAANLVLCHNPDAVDVPLWAGYRGWILAGHTHGGQCRAPFLAPPILPIANARYAAGHIDLGDGRQLYVNRALGYLQRVRFNVRPEITVFKLEKALVLA